MERKRKRNNFSRALQEAKKRVKSATKERERIRKRLDHLNREIPSLERTIKALQQQLNPELSLPVGTLSTRTLLPIDKIEITQPIDPELAELAGPQDLTGLGSIPPGASGPVQPEFGEDELLDAVDRKINADSAPNIK